MRHLLPPAAKCEIIARAVALTRIASKGTFTRGWKPMVQEKKYVHF